MPRRLKFSAALLLALVLTAGAAQASEATLTLFPDVAVWNEKIEVRIEGIGCTELTHEPFVNFSPGEGWTVDIDLKCPLGSNVPFSLVAELGPLVPADYVVRVHNSIRDIVSPPPPPFDTATLSVRRQASLEIELPEVATDAAPFPIVYRGPASSICFRLDAPVVTGNVIETSFFNSCEILPPGGPNIFREEFQVGPLPAGEYDVRIFDLDAPQGQQPYLERKTLIVHDADGCVSSDTALCLQGGRFRIEVDWKNFQGGSGKGHAIPFAERDDSGLFWYFNEENVELTAKVLNGCSLGGNWWVFLSSGSTVEYTVTVTDTLTDRTKTYKNDLGESAPLLADTSAFSCNP